MVDSGLWFLDYLYGYFFKTYRLEVVEFSPLPSGSGVQMLWTNPPGFNANSGEYVKVQLPWLLNGGNEWHPFSIYLREETAEGLDEVLRKKFEVNPTRVHLGGVKVGRAVEPSKTALLLSDCQNEFASEGGKMYESVKDIMEANNMMQNLVDLVACARSVGVTIFHTPIMLDESGVDNPNMALGILKTVKQKKYFAKGTWNVEIVDCLKPNINDIIIQNKKGLDAFIGTDLQDQLQKRGIDTIIIGGFRSNCSVESTIRTGYEKGYNMVSLIDGSATIGHAEHKAAVEGTWKMFSTPMSCFEVTQILSGEIPIRFKKVCRRNSLTVGMEEIEAPPPPPSEAPSGDQDLSSFVRECMLAGNHQDQSFILEEARQEIRSQYNTTQVFMAPAGDWTKTVYEEVTGQRQLRSCWVKGPFVSPYSNVGNFSHLVLIASGIGITPALGVLNHYKGRSRTKVLIWSTRCPNMLKFFTPLFTDAAMAIIYYTGKEKLSTEELKRLRSGGNIYIQQSRPDDLTQIVSTVITKVTSLLNAVNPHRSDPLRRTTKKVNHIPHDSRKHWCIFYCGGSKRIRDLFSNYSKKEGVDFHYELFDW